MTHDWTAIEGPGLPEGLYAERCGSGPVIIFVAGNGGGTAFWYPLAPLLADHFTLVAMDYRAAPQHDDKGGLFETAARKAQDVPKVLHVLGLKHAIVLGHSTGAQAAARLAASRPDCVSHLIFSGGYAAPHPYIEESMRLRQSILETLGGEAFLLDSLFRAVPPAHLFAQLETDGTEKILAFRELPDIPIESARIDAIRTGDVSALLGQINVRTSVLHARDDSVFPYPLGEAVAQQITDATLTPVESGGHLAPMLAPDVYGEALLGVLTP